MHTITIGPAARMQLSTQLVVTDDPWSPPRLRLQVRTDTDGGVILDFGDAASLHFLVSTLRTLLSTYRDTQRRSRPAPRPKPRALGL